MALFTFSNTHNMNQLLINNLDFAKKQDEVTQDIDIERCERLLDLIEKDQQLLGRISYTLTGRAAELGLPSLALHVEAALPVLCQRCLQIMQLDLSADYTYVITENEPEPFAGDEEVDWLEISREMNVDELVEDELLMAIPLGPLHKHACKPLVKEDVEKPNPFAVLKNLIK
ncbi:MAG: YceD family protein [Methylophilaceae bacterium]